MSEQGWGGRAGLCGLLLLGLGAADASAGSSQLIADFTFGRNWRSGFHGAFASAPSWSNVRRVADVVHRPGGYALRASVSRQAGGFAGAWVDFFDYRLATPAYLDATPYNFLSFWVRGQRGGEEFTVAVADEQWLLRDDAFAAGPIRDFLPGGVTTEWREVLVPLAILPLDVRRLAFLSLDFNTAGDFVVYVDDVSLKVQPGDSLPSPQTTLWPAPGRAVWQWDSRNEVNDPVAGADFLDFCRREGIGRVWMYLPHRDLNGGWLSGVESLWVHRDALREFLAAAHARGIAVEVLEGIPEDARRENHPRTLALVDAVIAFNDGLPAAERFDGVHLDIEPYLLSEWAAPKSRKRILTDYLKLGVESQRRLAEAGIRFGVDIPFWWQYASSGVVVNYGGASKPVAFHCIDRFDAVGVMNYQPAADGRGGMIAHGTGLLAYAESARRGRVYLATEAGLASGTAEDFLWQAGLAENDFRRYSRFSGTGFHHYDSYRTLVEGR